MITSVGYIAFVVTFTVFLGLLTYIRKREKPLQMTIDAMKKKGIIVHKDRLLREYEADVWPWKLSRWVLFGSGIPLLLFFAFMFLWKSNSQ